MRHMVGSAEDESPRVVILDARREDDPCSIAASRLPAAWHIETCESISAALERCDDAVDCLVTPYELADGAAAELLDGLPDEWWAPPVVLVADASDGTVPAEAVTHPYADVVAADEECDVAAAVVEAVESVVPDCTAPEVNGAHPTDSRSMDAWKARLFDQFFTKIPLHMFVKDREARHVLVSEGPVGHRHHEASDAYLGQRDIDGMVPESEAREPYEDDMTVMETGEPILDKHEYYPTSDRWFQTSKVPWEDADGSVCGVLGVAQEITDQKDRERQLKVINHVVRHNMRNKLNIVIGRSESPPTTGATVSENLDRISNAAADLVSIIDKQQTIVEVMVGAPDPETTDLSAVARTVVDSFAAEHPDATIRCRVEDGLTVIATEIHHALGELLENAVVHGPNDEPCVEVTATSAGGTVELCVRDSGAPIPSFEVEILTGRRDIDQLSHSSGFGLWLVRWIVKQSGGSVEFANPDSEGNEVTITLPAADPGE